MPNRKRHLMVGFRRRAACGLDSPKFRTFLPAEVTCLACKRTLLMADAEVKAGHLPEEQQEQPTKVTK